MGGQDAWTLGLGAWEGEDKGEEVKALVVGSGGGDMTMRQLALFSSLIRVGSVMARACGGVRNVGIVRTRCVETEK